MKHFPALWIALSLLLANGCGYDLADNGGDPSDPAVGIETPGNSETQDDTKNDSTNYTCTGQNNSLPPSPITLINSSGEFMLVEENWEQYKQNLDLLGKQLKILNWKEVKTKTYHHLTDVDNTNNTQNDFENIKSKIWRWDTSPGDDPQKYHDYTSYEDWYPQGIAVKSDDNNQFFVFVGWHGMNSYKDLHRVSFIQYNDEDLTPSPTKPGALGYRHVLLVEPQENANFANLKNHNLKSIAIVGQDFLYEADADLPGLRVYVLFQI